MKNWVEKLISFSMVMLLLFATAGVNLVHIHHCHSHCVEVQVDSCSCAETHSVQDSDNDPHPHHCDCDDKGSADSFFDDESLLALNTIFNSKPVSFRLLYSGLAVPRPEGVKHTQEIHSGMLLAGRQLLARISILII